MFGLLGLCWFPSPPGLALEDVHLSASEWARPRSGDRVARLPGLRALVDQFDERAQVQFLVRHAGGDEGVLWAEELKAWLVALGVPAARVVLRAAAVPQDELVISMEHRGN